MVSWGINTQLPGEPDELDELELLEDANDPELLDVELDELELLAAAEVLPPEQPARPAAPSRLKAPRVPRVSRRLRIVWGDFVWGMKPSPVNSIGLRVFGLGNHPCAWRSELVCAQAARPRRRS